MDWEQVLCGLITVVLAVILTVLDMDKTFYIPRDAKKRLALRVLWWSFAVANGCAALILYFSIKGLSDFRSWNPFALAATTGVAYLAILRAKLATFRFEGKDVPFGFEALYDACREYIFKRINRIAKEARRKEALELSRRETLATLAQDAFNAIENDALTSEDEKADARQWLENLLEESVDGEQKRLVLAIFILSGRRGRTARLNTQEEAATQ